MQMTGIGKQGMTPNRYLYNAQTEREESFGLQWDETPFRRYDPQLGRFHGVDALAAAMPGITPYQYAFNNPVMYNDPSGLAPTGERNENAEALSTARRWRAEAEVKQWRLEDSGIGGNGNRKNRGVNDIILKGSNGSSVTVKTDLVHIEIDASSLLGDLGGNITLKGDEVLDAALDIGGTLDPSNILDGVAMAWHLKKGRYWSAAASGAGLFWFLGGDALKLFKLRKHIRVIRNAIRKWKKAQKRKKFNKKGKHRSRGNLRPRLRDDIIDAANQPGRGGRLTVAGRSLQKHGANSRPGSPYPVVRGSTESINSQADALVKTILNDRSARQIVRHHARFGHIVEYIKPGVYGIRVSHDGKKFFGFID